MLLIWIWYVSYYINISIYNFWYHIHSSFVSPQTSAPALGGWFPGASSTGPGGRERADAGWVLMFPSTYPSPALCMVYVFTYKTGWCLGQMLVNIHGAYGIFKRLKKDREIDWGDDGCVFVWKRTRFSERLDWIDDGYVSWTLDISIDGVL